MCLPFEPLHNAADNLRVAKALIVLAVHTPHAEIAAALGTTAILITTATE